MAGLNNSDGCRPPQPILLIYKGLLGFTNRPFFLVRSIRSNNDDFGRNIKTQTDLLGPPLPKRNQVFDGQGEELYPRKWNHEFIDMPVVT